MSAAGVKTAEATEFVKRTAAEAIDAHDVFVDEQSDGGKRRGDVDQIPGFSRLARSRANCCFLFFVPYRYLFIILRICRDNISTVIIASCERKSSSFDVNEN